MKELNCPICGGPMKMRTITGEHVNASNKVVKKYKYYQYYCPKDDSDDIGYTTTESDEQSLRDFK